MAPVSPVYNSLPLPVFLAGIVNCERFDYLLIPPVSES